MAADPGNQLALAEKIESPLSIVLSACDVSTESMTAMVDRLEQRLGDLLREDVQSPSTPPDRDSHQHGGVIVTRIVRHNVRLTDLNDKVQSLLNRLDV